MIKICFFENNDPMISGTLTEHHAQILRTWKETSQYTQGFLEQKHPLIWLFPLKHNKNHVPHLRISHFSIFFHYTKHVIRNFFALIWHSTVDEGYYLRNFWWYFFPWCTFYRCTAHKINTLCSTEDISQVNRDHMRYMCNMICLTPEVYTLATKLSSALTEA